MTPARAISAVLVLLAAAPPDEGKIVTAASASLGARDITLAHDAGRLVVRYTDSGGARGSLPAEDVVEVALPSSRTEAPSRPTAADVEVVLTTGDVLCGKVGERTANGIALASKSYGNHVVKLDHVRAVLFTANQGFRPRVPPGKVENDLILSKTGNQGEGTLNSISDSGVEYKSKLLEKNVELPLDQCVGVWLIELPPGPPKELTTLFSIIHTTDRSSMRGTVQSLKEGVLSFTDLYGTAYKIPADQVSSIYMKNGRVVYLSDVDPASTVEDANFIRGPQKLPSDLDFPFQRDRSARGSPIVLGGIEHRKGVGVRAHSALTYALGGAYKRFQTTVGLDACAMGLGAVTAEVWVDGRKAKEAGFRQNDPPLALDIDVTGARELKLVVTWAGAGQSDFADWGSARLIR